MVKAGSSNENFFLVMGRELFGAIAVGVVISLVCYPIFAKTKDILYKRSVIE